MSRCFPFPPPGYEKARNDSTDLLKKEKHKEKKQKKDKKEREKKDRKEKHDKDRSKDKKDRKEKHKDKDRDKDKDKTKTPDSKKLEVKPQNGERLRDKNTLHLQELAKRLRDDDQAFGSQMVQKASGDIVPMVVERIFANQLEEKDKIRNKIEDHRKVNGKNEARGLEKTFSHQNFSSFDERVDRVEAIVKLDDKKNFEKQMEAKEKNKQKVSDGKGAKLVFTEREKSKKSKDKDRGKEEKKKAKEIIEQRKDHFKLNEKVSKIHEDNKEPLDFRNINSPPKPLTSEGNLGKRKEINGYSLDNGIRANKLPRNMPFNDSVLENGKKPEFCHTTIDQAPEPRLATNHKVENKEQKLNGSIAKEKGENFSKPPHPDSKYLSQILSVPKMEEWCDLDDQDWLFSSTNLKSKKSTESSSVRQVWAEAFRIDSADISVLPYVIPY